jgi:predicted DNA-binding transcriptional regulator YafY
VYARAPADRLFQLGSCCERGATPLPIRCRLAVSARTVYRDVQDLVASGVPIEGEAGVDALQPG